MSTIDTTNLKSSADKLLELSRKSSSVVLCHFQVNHDMCKSSGFFPDQTLQEVDQCALSFRDLGLETVTVATQTSNTWISTVILFYENISKTKSETRKKMFEKLGGQAKKFSKIYRVIAAWARYVSGLIGEASCHAKNASEAFIKEYDAELVKAQETLDQAKTDLQTAKDTLDAAKDKRDDYETGLKAAAAGIILGPIGLALGFGLAGSGYSAADDAVDSAQAAEEQAEQDVEDAQKDFDKAKNDDDRAKKIGKVTATLRKALNFMNMVTEEIAIFWTAQANNFGSQASKMIANEPNYEEDFLGIVSLADIDFWKRSKQDLDKYAVAMGRVMNLYNYTNEASPIPTTKLEVAKLSFSMHVPSGVDVASIMD